MKLEGACTALAVALVLAGCAAVEPARREPDALTATIAALDRDAFYAFNRCSDPAQLARHASFFSDDVEFYHDNGGLTRGREAMLANTAKFVCGNFRRELLPGTLRVYPVKDFGAIAIGGHRFCSHFDGKCEGMAEFTVVWERRGDAWRITRVLSYAHRPYPSP